MLISYINSLLRHIAKIHGGTKKEKVVKPSKFEVLEAREELAIIEKDQQEPGK